MTPFYLTLFSTYVLSLLARITKKKNEYPNLYFSILVIVIMCLFSGLRNGIGDTPAYVHLYSLIGPGYDSKGGYEEGFILFLKILKNISSDPQFMIFVTGVITTALNLWTIRRYCNNSYYESNVHRALMYYNRKLELLNNSIMNDFEKIADKLEFDY